MACSKNITINGIANAAQEKGIQIIGTGDFTHPEWIKEIREMLVESEQGLYKLKDSKSKTRFILSSEICTVYSRNGKARRIHNCVLVPSIESVMQINEQLAKRGNLKADGRPILGMSGAELIDILLNIDEKIIIFPAHIWTPYFGVFGAMSGFDSMKEAYEERTSDIHAFETGLSSDPLMNWRVSELDKYTILSNSDAHSLQKLGREANVFEIPKEKISYNEIYDAIIKKNPKKIKLTVEYYPEEGKYHLDGHRLCNVSMTPEEAIKHNNICPVCKKKLTIGVLHRVEELADRPAGFEPEGRIPFVHSVPLQEVIAYLLRKNANSQIVEETLKKLVEKFGSEFNIMLNADLNSISEIDKDLAEAIKRIRNNEIKITAGYDGVFGILDILDKINIEKPAIKKRDGNVKKIKKEGERTQSSLLNF
jgi:uncharacterized protein (TIGR00375 family)